MNFPQVNTGDMKKAKLELCNPEKETIAILNEAYNINVSIKTMQINTLEFCLPLHIDYYGEKIDNPHLADMLPYYLVRLTIGDYREYFRITRPKDEGGNEDYKFYYCLSYISTLADRRLVSYSVVSYTIKQVLEDILRDTNWTIKKVSHGSLLDIDPEFDDRFRSVDSGDTNILNFIYDNLANAYNCLPIFDTETEEISIYAPGNVGKDLGLTLSYKKYIDTFGLELDVEEFTTRLSVRGKDGLSIREVTPSGQPYLENFSYFMQGFEQDAQGNVISSSPYWSDELCKAQIAYTELLESKEGEFEGYLDVKSGKNQDIKSKEAELELLLQSLHQTQEVINILMGAPEQYFYYNFNYTGANISQTVKLNSEYKYVCLGKTTSAGSPTIKFDNNTIAMQSNVWRVLGRSLNKSSCKIDLTGTGSANVTVIVAKIFDEEVAETDEFLIDKYCEDKWDEACNAKIAEIDTLYDAILNANANIEILREELSAQVNFPPELLKERNKYVIEKLYDNNNITDPRDLLETAIEFFEQVNSPTLVLELSLVNFLDIVSDDSDKLFYSYVDDYGNVKLDAGLYDKIRVYYEPFGTNVDCMITEINLDIENFGLNFVLSNVRDTLTGDEKLVRDIGKTSSATTSILQEKYKWEEAKEETNIIRQLLEGTWDAATREINAGANEDVQINRYGITVIDPTNPNNIVRIISGWIGLSQDGGKSFRTAINAKGVYASELVGRIIAGENLILTNESGTFEVSRDGVKISGMSLTIGGGLPDNQIASANDWNAKETPEGAQDKADIAEQAAMDYATLETELMYLELLAAAEEAAEGMVSAETEARITEVTASLDELREYIETLVAEAEQAAKEGAVEEINNKLSQYLNFDSNVGLTLGAVGSPSQIVIDNRAMQFMNLGSETTESEFTPHPQAVAYLHGKKFYIESIEVLQSLKVGNHVLEKYDEETTLIRWVG